MKKYKELLADILIQLYGSTTSYTNVKAMVRRYERNKEIINQVIASRLSLMLDEFTDEQLEFIVYNVGEAVLDIAPKLYEVLKKRERDDLIRVLRVKWANSWLKRKTKVLPAECPRCGFNALMPDLTCLVCGSTVSEREVKEHIRFDRALTDLLERLNCDGLKRLLSYEYVILEGSTIKEPWSRRLPIDIELFLIPSEKKLISDFFEKKCGREQ